MYELEGQGVIPLNKKSYSSSRDIVYGRRSFQEGLEQVFVVVDVV
jgi:hypothetical protein